MWREGIALLCQKEIPPFNAYPTETWAHPVRESVYYEEEMTVIKAVRPPCASLHGARGKARGRYDRERPVSGRLYIRRDGSSQTTPP